ncbi:MAG: hypothetical protein K6F00_06145 [Lachnospiraceae bacterium]|nr:hypothetical protein [Lachnospiraceae bacterium]
MAKGLSDNEIRAALDEYLEAHYGNEPVLSLVPSKDIHELKFHLVEDTITLVCDEGGNITEKKRKRRLPKSEMEGQLSLSDIVTSPKSDTETVGEDEGVAGSALDEDVAESVLEEDAGEVTHKDEVKAEPKKKPGKYKDGQKVVNIFTGDVYTVVGSLDNMLRVRPEGELSTIMLTAADVSIAKEES